MRERAREQLKAFTDRIGELQAPPNEGVIWNGTLAQLAYLLHQLREARLLGNTDIWALSERAFVKSDGSPVKRTSMKAIASKHGFNQDGVPPTRADDIEKMINQLIDGLPADQ